MFKNESTPSAALYERNNRLVFAGSFHNRRYAVKNSVLGYPVLFVELKDLDRSVNILGFEWKGEGDWDDRDPDDHTVYVSWSKDEPDDFINSPLFVSRGHRWTRDELLLSIGAVINSLEIDQA